MAAIISAASSASSAASTPRRRPRLRLKLGDERLEGLDADALADEVAEMLA